MPFWTIFMILGITAETTQLIKSFALAQHEEFKTPSFLLNYIIVPVNRVLQKYREHTQNSKKGASHNTTCRTRIQQLLQFDLTRIIIKFLIKEFGNEEYDRESQTQIVTAIDYVNQYMEEDTQQHTKPNKIALLIILGYCDHIERQSKPPETQGSKKK